MLRLRTIISQILRTNRNTRHFGENRVFELSSKEMKFCFLRSTSDLQAWCSDGKQPRKTKYRPGIRHSFHRDERERELVTR